MTWRVWWAGFLLGFTATVTALSALSIAYYMKRIAKILEKGTP